MIEKNSNKNYQVKAFAPATVANVVCGYDVLGFAIEQPGDVVSLTLNNSGKVTIESITGDGGLLPVEPEKNVASAVVISYLKKIGIVQGVSIQLEKNMPLNSGLGSSSASSVAALTGINHLMGNLLTKEELLPFAMEGEFIACGNAHADNVAPALLGGLVLIRSYLPLDVVKLPFPEGIYCSAIHPYVDVPTGDARKIIKDRIALRDAVTQWGNVAGLTAGFCTNNIELIGRSMQDVIIEPVRAMLIPYFYKMKQLALDLGAIGFGISGSGPTVFALSKNEVIAKEVTVKLEELLMKQKISCDIFVSKINKQGAYIIEKP